MAITRNAKKAIRVSARKKVFNDRRKRSMKEVVKEIKVLVAAKDVKGAEAKLPEAYKAIDKAAKRGVIKKNTASRKKSRLTAVINKAA